MGEHPRWSAGPYLPSRPLRVSLTPPTTSLTVPLSESVTPPVLPPPGSWMFGALGVWIVGTGPDAEPPPLEAPEPPEPPEPPPVPTPVPIEPPPVEPPPVPPAPPLEEPPPPAA